MKNLYLLSLALVLSSICLGQIQPLNVNIESPHLRQKSEYSMKTTTCVSDTVQYTISKATGLSALTLNNATSAYALGQYFDVPQPIIISGTDFYAYKTDLVGGASINVTVSIYNASPTDSLPTGAPIGNTTIIVDTSFGGGSLDTLRKSALFSSPITVTQPYVIVIENNSANSIGVVNSSYTAADGAQEWLSFANLFGTWTHGYGVSVGTNLFDADVIIEPYISHALTANFTSDAGCLPSAQSVNFTDISSPILQNRMYNVAEFIGSPELSYTYNYGDGAPVENLINPTHAYSAAGPYTVVLTDTIFGWSRNCFTDTTITIGNELVVDYSIANNGLHKTFTDITTSTSTASSWLWDFGDGNTSTMQNPSHTYATTGVYTVCLTVNDACGQDSTCHFVDASCSDPISDFSSTANYLAVSFTDNSTSSQTLNNWLWDFGDGNTATSQAASHTYTAAGTYKVCLTVTDICGNDSTCQFINVVEDHSGISKNNDIDLKLYPNPVKDILNITFETIPSQIDFITITGQKIAQFNPNTKVNIISVSNWAKGVYFAQFKFKDGSIVTKKIMVE